MSKQVTYNQWNESKETVDNQTICAKPNKSVLFAEASMAGRTSVNRQGYEGRRTGRQTAAGQTDGRRHFTRIF
jgi:hypothetical protein